MAAQLLSTIENSKAYTLAVARSMPATHYQFKPVNDVFNFSELLTHIGYGILWWEKNYIRGIKSEWAPDVKYANQNEVIRYLEYAFDLLLKTVSATKTDEAMVKGVFATLDHVTHHRGQATVYLRMNGIAPPEYTF